jgi:hypothetical protein
MLVTGYMLREALKSQELRRDTAANAFPGSLKKFENETKESPRDLMGEFLAAENAIAIIQMAQAHYNLRVRVTVEGKNMPLAEAIKRMGAVARSEKMWRSATGSVPNRFYDYRSNDERAAGVQVAVPTVTSAEAVKNAQVASKSTSAYRAAIATGNAVELGVEGLDPKLFE